MGGLFLIIYKYNRCLSLGNLRKLLFLVLGVCGICSHVFAGNVAEIEEHNREINYLKSTILANPANMEAKLKLGRHYLELAEEDRVARTRYSQEALGLFQEVLKSTKYVEESWIGIGEAYILLGNHEEGKGSFQKAIAYNPDSLLGHSWLFMACVLKHEYRTAIKEYLKVNEIDSKHARALLISMGVLTGIRVFMNFIGLLIVVGIVILVIRHKKRKQTAKLR